MTDATRSRASTMRMSKFHLYASAGFQNELLPIVPPDASMHPDSSRLIPNRGKIPGRKRADGWVGFKDWTQYSATPEDIRAWETWEAGVGLQGRRFPALDIDVEDYELAEAIHEEAVKLVGPAPARFGRGERRILVFNGPGMRKQRIAFRRRGTADAAIQAVEFLASGQQYVVEGIHPTTNQPYAWQDDRSPIQVGTAGLTSITADQLQLLFSRIERLLDLHGYEVITRSATGGAQNGDHGPQVNLLAPNFGSIGRALAAIPNDVDYDTWIKIGVAVKASAGPEREQGAYHLWEDWSLEYGPNTPEIIAEKWESFRPPFRVGWGFLAFFAQNEGDGQFLAIHKDVQVLPATLSHQPRTSQSAAHGLEVAAMFDRCVWVEALERVCDLETGDLLSRSQFNVRNRHIGDPNIAKDCAWAVLTREIAALQIAKSVTYRPGAGLFIDEDLPGLTGRCVNTWRAHDAALPDNATNDDVRVWLDHCAFIIPDEREREIVLDWLAWIVQHPGEKPNWALLIGSTVEGMGKDLMLEPVRVALGAGNVREITAEDISSKYTDFLAGTRLLLVNEMELNERKQMMNRLKPLIAAPPYTLRVNVKHQPQYPVPNTVAVIFFTNMENALAISAQDRRYFVCWNDGVPRDAAYYERLVSWYSEGGGGLAARWLLDRDTSGFKAKGRAPDTAAKTAMRLAALPDMDATIHDAFVNRDGPFSRRLVTVGEVAEWIRNYTGPFKAPDPRRLARSLKAVGAIQFDRRPSLGPVPPECHGPHAYNPKQVQLFARPGDVAALELLDDLPALRAEFWAERLIGHDDFGPDDVFGDVK